jgi:hypothetical protein
MPAEPGWAPGSLSADTKAREPELDIDMADEARGMRKRPLGAARGRP